MLYRRSKEIRMKIKPPTTNPDLKALLKRRFPHPASLCRPFQAWLQSATLPDLSRALYSRRFPIPPWSSCLPG